MLSFSLSGKIGEVKHVGACCDRKMYQQQSGFSIIIGKHVLISFRLVFIWFRFYTSVIHTSPYELAVTIETVIEYTI